MSRASLSLFLLLGAVGWAQEPATPRPPAAPSREEPQQQPPPAEPATPAPATPASEPVTAPPPATPVVPAAEPAPPSTGAKAPAPAEAEASLAPPGTGNESAPKTPLARLHSASLIPPAEADLNGLVTWYAGVRQSLARELAAAQKAGLPTEAACLIECLDTARRNVLAAYARLAPRAR